MSRRPADPRERQSQPSGRLLRRGSVVLGIVVLALVAFGSTTQTWLVVRLPQEAVQTPDLAIAGSDAATPVTAFALVALAAAIAVSIAGRVARWVIAVILVLSGLGVMLSSAGVALDPAAAAEPAIGAAIGVSGLPGAESEATVLPWLAVAAGLLLVLAAGWVILAGRRWGINRRYDAGRTGAGTEAHGTLPAAPRPSTGDIAPGVVPDEDTGPPARAGRRSTAHADEIDSWDELSRGNDPTG